MPKFGSPNVGAEPLTILEVAGEKTGHISINNLPLEEVDIFFVNGVKFVRESE